MMHGTPTGKVVPGAFKPHPLLRNAHVQTIASLFRPMPKLALTIERRELADGDFVDLGWCSRDARESGAPLAVLLHGLSGGFDSKYARGLALQLNARGWKCVILQFRGAGPEPNRLPRTYHHGDTQDLRELLQLLRQRQPRRTLAAVGWSLGGNVLLKYLGEEGSRALVSKAVAVCPPFQLRPCAEKLRTGFSRVYQSHLLGELKRMFARKHAVAPLPVDMARVLAARDFIEFDNHATAPINGFRDADDYYERSSCGGYLAGIRVPALIVHALDDPFMTPSIMPKAEALPPGVTLELCRHGGHVGFYGGTLSPEAWLEQRIPEFLGRDAA